MKARQGYTLIEVVATLALVALLAVPLASLLTQGLFQYHRAGRRTREAAAAVALVEELKALPYSFLVETLLSEERLPGEYPYVTGRHNYYESAPEEEGGIFYRLHLLQDTVLLNQEPRLVEIILLEVLDGEGLRILVTCRSGWEE